MRKILLSVLFLSATGILPGYAQENLAEKYRQMALDYNHDLKTAERNVEASMELEKLASAGLKPALGGNASYQFTGNPTELSLALPGLSSPVSFRGDHSGFGASVSLIQPIYTGGRLLETLRKARHQQSLTRNQAEMVRAAVCYQTDLQYWNTVARNELVTVNTDFRNSIASLAETIRERVEAGLTDPQDLLMAEVKLNEAEYMLSQARNNFETGRMALNSMIGVGLADETPVAADVAVVDADPLMMLAEPERPEVAAAREGVKIAKSNLKIAQSKYLPQLSVGAEGSLGKPGYDFKPDVDPNYALYARLSVPLFEWGKRKHEKKASQQQIGMAEDKLAKTKDEVNLETRIARTSLSHAISQSALAASSLDKARENEQKATERYAEGKISILEVIDARVYRMNSQMNYTVAKMNARAAFAGLMKALNLYGNDGNIVSLY